MKLFLTIKTFKEIINLIKNSQNNNKISLFKNFIVHIFLYDCLYCSVINTINSFRFIY